MYVCMYVYIYKCYFSHTHTLTVGNIMKTGKITLKSFWSIHLTTTMAVSKGSFQIKVKADIFQ